MYDFKERLEKLDGLSRHAFELETEVAELMHQVKAKQALFTTVNKQRDEIKASIRDELLADGNLEETIDGVSYKLRKLPQRMEVLCKPEELPEEYQRIKIEANKVKLKADMKEGEASNYCKLSEVEYKLVIEHA